MHASLNAIAQVLALRFLDSLAEGTLLCLLAALFLRFAPRQNASTRFAVWFSVLVAIAASPWIAGALPHPRLSAAAAPRAAILLPDSWALYFMALWSVVVLWFVLGVVRALWHLRTLRRESVPIARAELDPILEDTLARHGLNREIAFCTSERVRVPTAVGLFKPTVLIPSWIRRELSATELNQILLHELAHFRRWDDWTNLFQQIVKAVFFFHPAVWWLDGRVAVEREMACDDAVLAETRSPRAYAQCLARLAEKSFVRRSIALAQAALGRFRQTSTRIAQILETNRPAPSSPSRITAVSLVAVLAVGCGSLYSRTPRLFAFGSSADRAPRELGERASRNTPESEYVPGVPITQASLKVPVSRARLTPRSVRRKAPNPQPVLNPRTMSPTRRDETLVRLTRSTSAAAAPLTPTLWVVVESAGMNPAAPQIYRIQMWRVTVVRTVPSAPNRQLFRSET
jgi:beta-lactamase regulating signal transducer with metallopeptidase domain